MPTKYQAIRDTVDGISFASKYEAAVYRTLKFYADKNPQRFTVRCQPQVEIYRGTCFPRRVWRCDFSLEDTTTGRRLLVEAKGMISKEFPYVLEMLETHSPNDFNSLIIVSDNIALRSKRYSHLRVYTLGDVHHFLHNTIKRGIYGNSVL